MMKRIERKMRAMSVTTPLDCGVIEDMRGYLLLNWGIN